MCKAFMSLFGLKAKFKGIRPHCPPAIPCVVPSLVSMCEEAGRRLLHWREEVGESAGTRRWTSCWGKGMTSQVCGDAELGRKTSEEQLRPRGGALGEGQRCFQVS